MVSLKAIVTVLLYLACWSDFTSAFLRKGPRRGSGKKSNRGWPHRAAAQGRVTLKPGYLPEVTYGARGGSIVLECEAVGIPSPTVHWLKNGVRLQQGSSHNVRDDEAFYEENSSNQGAPAIQLSATRSRLYLDCLTSDDEAVYSCVGESPFVRRIQSTKVKLVKPVYAAHSRIQDCFGRRQLRAEPARIYMWTVNRLEYEDNKVQMYCRAQGHPEPTIIWYDPYNNLIEDGDNYKIAKNGDLIIDHIMFRRNMGSYRCVADNGFGTNSTESFLYPAGRD